MKKQMIKRADGSYSQRGLWDNIRANRGSGKKPTAQMLKQERKIKSNMAEGGINNPGFQALPGYVQAKIRANMQEGGMTGSPIVDMINNQSQMPMMQMGAVMPQTSAGQSVLQEAMAMSVMQSGGELNRVFNKANRKDAPVVLNPKNKNQFYLNKQMDTDLSYRQHQQMLNQSLGKPYIDELGNEEGNTPIELDSRVEQAYRISNLRNSLNEKNKMQSGGKMPVDIARARFMAAANGNASKAKETASKYGYKMQSGGMNLLGVPNMNSGTAGFDFAKASAYANAPKEEVPTDIERMQEIDIRKKRSFMDRVKGTVRNAGRRVGLGSPAPKTDSQQVMDEVVGQVKANEEARIKSNTPSTADRSRTAFNKIKSGDVSMKNIGDYMEGFGTYLNASSDRNVVTDLFDMGVQGAAAVGANNVANNILQTKKSAQLAMQSPVGAAVDLVNPFSIGANLVSGTADAMGELSEGNYGEAAGVATKTAALAALKGKAGNVSKNALGRTASAINRTKVGSAASNAIGSATKHGVGHQLQHAGQHMLLSPLLAHKNGGSIKDMYYMKNGGQFPDRYKKMGFSGVDKPKRTTSGGKSHAVVTKVDGNYKLIRFGQAGEVGSPDGSARNKAFKARHAKNIAKGKSSAAYWANKVKW